MCRHDMIVVPHPNPISGASYSAVELMPDDDQVVMLDQRLLPNDVVYHQLRTVEELAVAIKAMWVRGAPAIGIAAAYGVVLAARTADSLQNLRASGDLLIGTRPTAVNLRWAVQRMLAHAEHSWSSNAGERVAALARMARAIHSADVEANRAIGRYGAGLVPEQAVIMTLCNAGALATGGYGTALGVVRAAHAAGKRVRVLACETRPLLQGARLTAWELHQDGIPVEVIPDNSAASILGRGEVSLCIVGADRVVHNGDVANKIGTYALSIQAKWHHCPFYVAAPLSSVDLQTREGAAITIEQRDSGEVTSLGATRLVPEGVVARNPAFDVTPAGHVTALITERGIASPLDSTTLEQLTQVQPQQ
jgi:methylthioribose-1-phosphate isomerase